MPINLHDLGLKQSNFDLSELAFPEYTFNTERFPQIQDMV